MTAGQTSSSARVSKRLMVWYVSGPVLRCVAGSTPAAPFDTRWTLVGPR
jgi:hypothetical protein